MEQLAEKSLSELPINEAEKASSLFLRLVQWKSFPVNTSPSLPRTISPIEEAFAELAHELNGTQAEE